MANPTWVGYLFAYAMIATSIYCAGRLLVAKRWDRRNHYDVNAAHILMGIAMVGMLVPHWNPVPNKVWVAVFSVIAVWFLVQSVRFVGAHGLAGTDSGHGHHLSHYLVHLAMALGMLFMYWVGVPSASGAMAMGSSSAAPATNLGLSYLFIAIFFASTVWQLDAMGEFIPQGVARAGASGSRAATLEGHGGGTALDTRVNDTATATGDDGRRWLAPRLEMACHITMCVTMGYMLVLML